MKVLVVIPARGGSKRLPNKNIKLLNNKPLIEYTIDAAKKVFKNNEICVTTDSKRIKEIAENSGLKVPFLRPKKLAQDTTSSQDTILHAIDWYNKNGYHPETVVLLQPTSPFREVNHIKEALKTFSSNIDMVVSVKETESNPYFVLFEENKNGYLRKTKDSAFTRKQDCPKVWEYNGSIYVMNVASLRKNKIEKFTKIKKFIMDDPVLSVDIDTEIDWIMAESILLTRKF